MTPNWTTNRPTQPGEYWLSIALDKRKGRIDFPSVIPCDVSLCANTYLMDRGSLDIGSDENGLTLAARYITGGAWVPVANDWYDGALWAPRETPADPFAKADTMRTDKEGREYNHDDREAKLQPELLIKKAIQHLRKRKPRNGRGYVYPLWKRVSDLFGHGSGYSAEICRRYGFDPDEQWRPEQQCPAEWEEKTSEAFWESYPFKEAEK